MDNKNIFISSLLGGTLSALMNATPILNMINCFCCIGIILGGAVAFYYFDKLHNDPGLLTTANAVTIGITTGIAASFISLILEWIFYLLFGDWQYELMQTLVEGMDYVPEYVDELMIQIEESLSYGFLWTPILIRNIIILPLFCLFGSLLMKIYLLRRWLETF